MNNVGKYLLSIAGVAIISASVSFAVVSSMQRNSFAGNTQMGFSAPTSANEYGFVQTVNGLSSARTVGNAPDLSPAAELAVHAVVHIRVDGEQQVDQTMIDPFEFFFGFGGGFNRPQSQAVTSFGSGVIISTDGYILTNTHVVENAKEMSVRLNDNRSFKAKLVGSDPGTDIALIKIDAEDLPTIPFGNSDDIRLGEWVLAVGNPFNLTSTVTAGIVSAKARPAASGAMNSKNLGSFIQTDAAINSGNSGGALVNAKGELIGINTMIYSQTGNYAGYSFAVPINLAAKVVGDIKKYGTVQRAVIGVQGQTISPELKEKYDLKVNNGVYVADFAEVSAAYAAGLEKGDVITHIDDKPISDMGRLQEVIGLHRPGDKIRITIDRKGTQKVFTVKLKSSEGNATVSSRGEIAGVELREISADQMRSFGIRYGVEVVKVKSGIFKKAGIKPGFIILSVNERPATKASEVHKIIAQSKKRSCVVKGFYSDGRIRYYELND